MWELILAAVKVLITRLASPEAERAGYTRRVGWLPVAMMTVSASTALSSVQIMKGRLDRSIFVTVSE